MYMHQQQTRFQTADTQLPFSVHNHNFYNQDKTGKCTTHHANKIQSNASRKSPYSRALFSSVLRFLSILTVFLSAAFSSLVSRAGADPFLPSLLMVSL